MPGIILIEKQRNLCYIDCIMNRLLILLLCSLPVLVASEEKPNCVCRAKDVTAREGQIVCLATPNGMQLARCERILNNTSWRFLQRRCDDKVS